MIKSIMYVGLGSAIGGMLRFLCYGLMSIRIVKMFPFNTLFVNVLGSFLIGALFVLFQKKNFSAECLSFFITGVLGGFTTFSAFSLETFQLIEQNQIGKAFLYALLSVFLGLLACWVGYVVTSLLSK
ncbi:fluoride efflux transporter CrcB [Capnocytophaga canis]|uniref:Fluoride-specific ion channel FluC n=1 Tax=Capnocytophaga canis TaxID=1848903 RepID=A0A3A1YFN8_9FLAO|nr:fluoride efflux transporter CrcB [Capnocytophaga canis]RIY36256.1 fluoride efflux transporter CrcB [Capnocytophaga canis]